MKLETQPLKKAMNIAVRFLDKKNVIPVTGMVKLDFDHRGLQVTTTNLDRTFTTEIKMFCPETYSVLIDGNRFHTFISRIDDESFDVSVDDKSFTVKRKGGKAQFLLCKERFHETPKTPDTDALMFDGDVLLETLNATLCGTDDDPVASQLWQTLVHFTADGTGFKCIASDRKRFVLVNGQCEGEGLLQIPVNAVQVLRSVLDDGKVKIVQSDSHVFVITDHTFIFRRSTAKMSTDIEPFLNAAAFETGFITEAESLFNALDLVRSMADSRLRSVKWELGDDVTFSTNASDVGHVEESLGVVPELKLVTGYNIDWLLAILRQLSGEVACEFWVNQGSSSLQIKRTRLTETKFIVGSLRVS